MPTSDPLLLTPVAREILSLQPLSVLDVGIGNGKWGVLAREYTDVWLRRERENYAVMIDGIEIFEKYRNVNWVNYNHIHIGHVTDILPRLKSYDLIIFIEVLEHIEKTEALELLDMCRSKCKLLIFSYTNCPQGIAFGNVNETHISTWAESDFVFPITLLAKNDTTFLYKARGLI
jgi:2-polyprenyl-3-methyl-5-hydroxy-6-metoxy-1,4-benzoquinol methylase